MRPSAAEDGLAKKNCHSIVISVPIQALSRNGQPVSAAANILDPNYIIGVWASASRQQIRTLPGAGGESYTGPFVQVSRLGMPLTNEVINPIGSKDAWNAASPYAEAAITDTYLGDPELDLYVDERAFGNAVPALDALELQTKSLAGFLPGALAAGFDFGVGRDGLFPLKGSALVAGTALDNAAFGNYLLIDNEPRSVDIKPIFHTGVPNLPPYQLATGKAQLTPGSPAVNPLSPGKPFVNNFMPFTFPGSTNPGGDMLRLNMAVPVTPRNSAAFSNDGLLAAAVAGLTDPAFAGTGLQSIPNMDGFPNGRRLEDAVDKIELKAIGGVVLAAIGLWYDDFTPTSPSVLTPNLGGVLAFTSGLELNDTTIRAAFPFVQTPWRGTGVGSGPMDAVEMRDLTVSDTRNVSATTYRNVVITSTGNVTLTAPLNLTGTLSVAPGGTLNLNGQTITGTGVVAVGPLASLRITDPAGLSAPGVTGSGGLRTTGLRALSQDANYIYAGSAAQVTGLGLPAVVGSLVISNAAGVTLTRATGVQKVLRLTSGTFSLNGQQLVLRSNALGTAMVVNQGGTVVGTATAQRYISTISNPGLGYRHLSSPTTNSTVGDLYTPVFNGYTPVVNPAYNAIPAPTLGPAFFPNIFAYNEQRAPTSGDFAVGYFSPNSVEDPLDVGRGYSVYIRGGLTPDFVGTLTQAGVTRSGLTRTGNFIGPGQKSGWHLLGNPFPSPLDWDAVPVPAGFSSAIFVFKSTGPGQAGIYLSRQAGTGTLLDGLLPLGQGFFGRVTGLGPVALTLPNAARPTDYPYTQPILYRGADTRPMLSLTLKQTGVAGAVADEAIVFFQSGATTAVDDRFDAERPAHNPGGVPTLATLTAGGNELAVNGLPTTAYRNGTVIPLLLDVASAGTYELALGKWANMITTDVSVALLDRQSNTRTPLTPGATYGFRAANKGVDMTRFAIVFGPAVSSPLSLKDAINASALVLWPNPASGQVQLAGGSAGATVTVYDVTGRAVMTTKADTVGAAALNLTGLTKGVYTVKVGAVSRRLVVE